MVLITLICPLNKPAAIRAISAWENDVENPNTTVAETVPSNPKRTMGLRPYKSDSRPHVRPRKYFSGDACRRSTREELCKAETGCKKPRVSSNLFLVVSDMKVADHEEKIWKAACHDDWF
jgi:hypothetical protein